MSPEREKIINGNKIEEYYWAGKMIVYVNNTLSNRSYEDCIEYYKNKTIDE